MILSSERRHDWRGLVGSRLRRPHDLAAASIGTLRHLLTKRGRHDRPAFLGLLQNLVISLAAPRPIHVREEWSLHRELRVARLLVELPRITQLVILARRVDCTTDAAQAFRTIVLEQRPEPRLADATPLRSEVARPLPVRGLATGPLHRRYRRQPERVKLLSLLIPLLLLVDQIDLRILQDLVSGVVRLRHRIQTHNLVARVLRYAGKAATRVLLTYRVEPISRHSMHGHRLLDLLVD